MITRYEQFKEQVRQCKSPLELTALLVATNESVCPVNTHEGRCDMKVCRQFSSDCCIMGMREYFEAEVNEDKPAAENNCDIRVKSKTGIDWRTLKSEIKAGNAGKYLAVEDEISVTLKDGRILVFSVADLKNNTATFVLKDLWFEEKPMNAEHTNKGGYPKSKMHTETLPEILKLMPDDLVEVITPKTITQVLDGETYSEDAKLWIPSYTEVFGTEDLDKDERLRDNGDEQFELFTHRRNRIKEKDGQAYYWWLRSPGILYTTVFWSVYSGGGVGSGYGAGYYSGVCFGFCI